MGCFLGCFGGEKEKTERRRRRSGRRSPHRERLNRPNGNTGIFQSVAIELGQPSLRQLILSPLPSLDPPIETISSENTPSLNPQIGSAFPSNTPLLNPQIEPDINENTQNTPSLVESVVNEINPLLEPPVEPVNPPVKEIREAKDQKSKSPPKKKVTFNLNLKIYEHPNYPSEDETEEEPVRENPKFPSNHRYQNWYGEEEDETEEILEIEEDEEDYYYSDEEYEDLDEIGEIVEDSYDSYFSLSIDKDIEVNNNHDSNNGGCINNNNEEVNGPICKNTPVLTPVENLSQWKERKSTNPSPKITLDSNLEKENNNNNNNDYYYNNINKNTNNNNNNNNYNNNNNGLIKLEISVDASLSTWLVNSSENSSVDEGQNGNFTSYNERPILGALTIEDIKESSVNNSPKRSPSKSPSREDVPIVGTVGTYWTCTGTSC